jgi:pyrimidine operon attenuation protein/uracil phosphoribosyltransferase
MQRRQLLDSTLFNITLSRLCHQIIENHNDFSNTVIIGLQPRGVYAAKRIHQKLSEIFSDRKIPLGNLDVTFYRDDFRRREIKMPNSMQIDFLIEDKNVILVDDVLYTGRTIRAGMDALLDFGRARRIELLVLVDRRYSRQLPISADYVGTTVDTISSEKVVVNWKETEGEDAVWLEVKK